MDVCSSGCGNSGNLTSLTDAAGGVRRFGYDRYGNLTQETDAQGNTTDRQCDAMGRVLRETRQRRINGVVEELVTTHEYDAAGNPTRRVAPDGTQTITRYNSLGQRQHETFGALGEQSSMQTTYLYAKDSRVVSKAIGSHSGTELTGYDAEGNVTETTDALERKTTMIYDAANRLVETIYLDTTPSTSDNPRQHAAADGQHRQHD